MNHKHNYLIKLIQEKLNDSYDVEAYGSGINLPYNL